MTDKLDTTTIRTMADALEATIGRLLPGARSMEAEAMRALCDALDELRADNERLQKAIIRQAGAAKTLRERTLAEVQRLKDRDRSEYYAAASLDGERKANEILTDENDKLRADNERLQAIIGNLHAVEEKHRETANTHFHRANRLQVENERLRAALETFADADKYYDPSFDDGYSPRWAEFFTIGDFRRARAALAQKGDRP